MSLGPGFHCPNLRFFGGSCPIKLHIVLSSNSLVPGIALLVHAGTQDGLLKYFC